MVLIRVYLISLPKSHVKFLGDLNVDVLRRDSGVVGSPE